jgi:protein-disulfide isomerase
MKIKQSHIWWGIGVVVIIGLLFSGRFMNPAPTPATNNEAANLLTVVSDDHVKGNPEAQVTLVEYLDFECEACGAYYPLIKQLGTEFPNDLRIVTRYFPLPGHKNSMTAAIAVEAAGKQGKYWEMHDMLFENQSTWGNKPMPTPQVFEAYAEQIGLDMEKFKTDAADPATKARVQRDFDASGKLGNNSTPSLFVQGKKIQNPPSYEAFKAVIQAEIDAASQN